MTIVDELEDIQWTDETADISSTCEHCLWENYMHADWCELDPEKQMADEEIMDDYEYELEGF